jgi:hypothetical protein
MVQPSCENLLTAGYNATNADQVAWEALREAECFRRGEYELAYQNEWATLKVDADYLQQQARPYARVLGLLVTHPCVQLADVILYVPDGARPIASDVAAVTGKDIAHAHRIPGGDRHSFMFDSDEDADLARGAEHATLLDDVTTTGSSQAAMRLMLQADQDVHALSILLRGTLLPKFLGKRGEYPLTFHFLAERQVPLDADEFAKTFGFEPVPDVSDQS